MAQVEMGVTVEEDGVQRSIRLIEESTFATDTRLELARARGKNGYNYPPMNSLHEGYAVILEEIEEFWDLCKLKPSKRNPADLYKELVQVAAMAQRTAEDLLLSNPDVAAVIREELAGRWAAGSAPWETPSVEAGIQGG